MRSPSPVRHRRYSRPRSTAAELLFWENEQVSAADKEKHIFEKEFLLKRPLLQAISMETEPVLLIDEIDRADEEFEAYLLEVLSDFQISIPEIGTVKATTIHYVVLTSNGTRELSDALRRRCLYHYIEYPTEDKELRIVMARLPRAGVALAGQIVRFVQTVRKEDLEKKPGIAETLDWTAALMGLGVSDLRDDPTVIHESLLCLLKTREDQRLIPLEVVERIAGKVAGHDIAHTRTTGPPTGCPGGQDHRIHPAAAAQRISHRRRRSTGRR